MKICEDVSYHEFKWVLIVVLEEFELDGMCERGFKNGRQPLGAFK